MFGSVYVKTKLMTTIGKTWATSCALGHPNVSPMPTSAPKSPKIAPLAPTVNESGLKYTTAKPEPIIEQHVDRKHARAARKPFDRRPDLIQCEHIKGDMHEAAVEERAVAIRQYW